MSFGMEYKNPNQGDRLVENSPRETVQSISWAPNGSLLVAGGWDSKVSCWRVNAQNGQTQAVAQISHDCPVLDTSFHHDGSGVFSSSCDKTVKLWNFQGSGPITVAKHDAPIKNCFWIKEKNVLLTGGWDKKLCYWDTRQQKPVAVVSLEERVYCMDVTSPLVLVATANREVIMYNLKQPGQPFRKVTSKLSFQSRCIAGFRNKQTGQPDGFALGSIEGRVAITHVNPQKAAKDFAFKCHRWAKSTREKNSDNQNQVYAINSINFNQEHWTFATAGSDGQYIFWDKDSKHRLKQRERCANSISAAAYDTQSKMYAYALGYDWSKGMGGYNRDLPNAIYLHKCIDEECNPRQG